MLIGLCEINNIIILHIEFDDIITFINDHFRNSVTELLPDTNKYLDHIPKIFYM